MRHTVIFMILTGLCTVVLLFPSFYNQNGKETVALSSSDEQPQQQRNTKMGERQISCKYYEEQEFMQSVSKAEGINVPLKGIKGGIVPHHLLAKDMIAAFLKTVSVEQPEIVVVVAPNHKGVGVKEVHTGSWSWQTPFGLLEADKDTVNSLIDSKAADVNFDLLEQDHSVSGLVPYIKYYMPDSKIVPVLLHGSCTLKDARQLGQNLQKKLENKKTVILASVDFSHYLSIEEADKMDEVSIQAIENRNFERIEYLDNDYMDSPPAIITLLSAMNTADANQMTVLEHSNSDRILGTRSSETTSYFVVVFYK